MTNIDQTYEEIKKLHAEYLAPHGIKLPHLYEAGHYTIQALTLVCLYDNIGKYVSKADLTKFVRQHIETNDVQSARHLSTQHGYFINKDRRLGYCLMTLKEVYPGYNKLKRTITLTSEEWTNLKLKFNYCCATCGAEEGEPHHVYYGTVQLQKGHIDPNKELGGDNVIPQCQFCNQQYQDRYIFFDDGRVKEINWKSKLVLKEAKEALK